MWPPPFDFWNTLYVLAGFGDGRAVLTTTNWRLRQLHNPTTLNSNFQHYPYSVAQHFITTIGKDEFCSGYLQHNCQISTLYYTWHFFKLIFFVWLKYNWISDRSNSDNIFCVVIWTRCTLQFVIHAYN